MLGRDHARADMLRSSRHAGVHGVDVEVVPAHHVACRDRPLIEVDVVAGIDDARCVVEVGQNRLAIASARRFDDMHRRSRRAEMHLVPPGFQIVFGIAGAERKTAGAAGQSVLDERARDAEAPVGVHEAPARRHDLDAAGDRLPEAHGFEQPESRLVDAFDVGLAERLVFSALHAWPNGRFLDRNGPRSERAPRFPSAPPAADFLQHAHCIRLVYYRESRVTAAFATPLASASIL